VRSRAEQLAWEERWSLPVALASFAAVALFVGAFAVGAQIGNGGESEVLRNTDAHSGARIVSAILQAAAAGLLAAPLAYLFRAAKARSERMRGQMFGIVVAAPIFLAAAAILTGVSTVHAASHFVSAEVPHLLAKGLPLDGERANEAATSTLDGDSLRPFAATFALVGQLGLVVAMFYTALYAMRTGLLSRLWGSLGMALGAVSFIPVFFQIAVFWFIYLGLLILGKVPNGRPPAWAAGEAVPWPTPGERAADKLSPQPDDPDSAETSVGEEPGGSSEEERPR
jgi:hypothetical protein